MPTLFVLVGPPGCGKTTWRTEHRELTPSLDSFVISQDDLIDAWAGTQGMTYSEAFSIAPLKDFERIVQEQFEEAVKARRNIILDRTNMTAKSRRKFLSKLPRGYQTTAILFEVDRVVLDDRLHKRGQATGKWIPRNVVDSMIRSFQAPTLEEFDCVVVVPAPKRTIRQRFSQFRRYLRA